MPIVFGRLDYYVHGGKDTYFRKAVQLLDTWLDADGTRFVDRSGVPLTVAPNIFPDTGIILIPRGSYSMPDSLFRELFNGARGVIVRVSTIDLGGIVIIDGAEMRVPLREWARKHVPESKPDLRVLSGQKDEDPQLAIRLWKRTVAKDFADHMMDIFGDYLDSPLRMLRSFD